MVVNAYLTAFDTQGMITDLLILLYLAIFVLMLTLLAEILSRRAVLPQWFSRKILHVGAVGACAIAPALLQNLILLTWIVAFIEPILLFLVATGRLFNEINGRKSWGIVLFPMAYLVLLIIFPTERGLIILPMAILAGSDAVAAVVGQLFAKKYYILTGDQKSLVGSMTFMCSVPFIYLFTSRLFPVFFTPMHDNTIMFWIGLLSIAILLSVLEALGSNGFDNIWIPLGAALLLRPFIDSVNTNSVIALAIGIFIALLFCIYTIRKKALTLDGAVVASLLGLWVVWFAGARWLIPLFFFFITGTLLGRLSKNKAQATDAKHGKARDYVQVICNGGIYAFLATFVNDVAPNVIFILMLISMAICTADTWSSEIGIYFRWNTYDMLRLKPVPPGLSGGVSLPGTLGGLMGGLAMAILGYFLLYDASPINLIAIITIAGFVGMLLDSILGASVQARYKNLKTNILSDNKSRDMILQQGWRWMTNDAVNAWSNALVTLGSGIFLYLISLP